MEIARSMMKTPPQPVLFGFVAVCLAGYATVRIVLIWRQISVLRREQQARQSLRSAVEDICARGWLLFDGLTNPRGHLLGSIIAGPGGLFTLIPRFIARGKNLSETIDQPQPGILKIGSHEILADPIGQARHTARALYEILAANGIDTVAVQPVIVFPGWVIGARANDADPDVWVVSDSDLVERLTSSPPVLEAKDLIAVSLLFEQLGPK